MSRAASATGDFKRRYLLARFFLAAVFFVAGFRFFATFFFTAMVPSRVDDDEDGDANRRRDDGACQSTRQREVVPFGKRESLHVRRREIHPTISAAACEPRRSAGRTRSERRGKGRAVPRTRTRRCCRGRSPAS